MWKTEMDSEEEEILPARPLLTREKRRELRALPKAEQSKRRKLFD